MASPRLVFGFVILLGTASVATAQENILAQVYGEGVHLLNRGELDCAKSTFDEAVSHGSNDPRVYYFRGLASLRMGRLDEADADFRQAATLEVEGAGTYDIGRALERVQGPERLALECVRREIKLMLAGQRPAAPRVNPLGPLTIPGFGRNLPPDSTDPFADDSEPKIDILPRDNAARDDTSAETEELPADDAQPEIDAEDSDPFAEPPSGEPGDDPGAARDATDAEAAPADDTPPAEDDPFSGGEDPFGQ